MIRVAINGILGRMGGELSAAILKDESLALVGGIDTLETFYSDKICVSIDPDEILNEADVAVDFSSPEGAAAIAEACRKRRVPLISGTTGLSEPQQSRLLELAKQVAVVQAFNFSQGINLLINLIQKAAAALQGKFDGEIVEIHHRNKKDSPSGTALLLARALLQGLGAPEEENIRFGRQGFQAERGPEIALHSLRGGSVVGEHQVHFLGSHENIVITHQALSRSIFVEGVLRAVRWIPSQKPGYYTMQDVLGLKA